MMSKVNAACKSLTARARKNHLETPAKQQVQSRPRGSSPNERLGIDIRGKTIEVIVKTKARKSGPTMVSSRQSASATPKVTEDSHANNWSKTLRDQNRPAMKQGVQQLAASIQSSKHSRHEERRDIKSSIDSHKSPKHSRQDTRILDEIPVRQPARISQEQISKTALNSGVPSTTTIASSIESVEVSDRAIQCGGIFDRANDRFSSFNPVRTIGFLMKEMEGLLRDERSSKILTEMEQALLRIDPVEFDKAAPADLENLALRAQLDAMTAKLAESSAKVESKCAAQRDEIETLLQLANKQAAMLEDAKHREKNLETEVKQMKIDLNEVLKSAAESRRTISQLQHENKSIEVTEKMVTELRRDLNEQIELAEQRFMEGQYLQLEKEKLMALSAYKDSKLIELRTSLQELQSYISEQLVDIREAGKRVKEQSSDNPASIVQTGAACSSPTSSCSINSIVPASCPELSELSLSTVDCFVNSAAPAANKRLSTTHLPPSYFNGLLDDSETGRLCDKTQLEFISLPGGEISHPISLSQRKDEEGTTLASFHNKKEEATSDRKIEGFHSVPDLGGRNARDSLHRVERENKTARPKSKTRKSSSAEKTRSSVPKNAPNREEDKKRMSGDRAAGDPVSIKEQFDMFFEDIRQQGKFPVHVPSPARSYPRPDWSDSSLPTISGISETNII